MHAPSRTGSSRIARISGGRSSGLMDIVHARPMRLIRTYSTLVSRHEAMHCLSTCRHCTPLCFGDQRNVTKATQAANESENRVSLSKTMSGPGFPWRFPCNVFLRIHHSLPSLPISMKSAELKRSGMPFQNCLKNASSHDLPDRLQQLRHGPRNSSRKPRTQSRTY